MVDGMISKLLQDQVSIPRELMTKYHSYGLNEPQVMILVQIYFFQIDDIYFPTPEEIAEKMTISTEQCSQYLRQLIQQGFLKIDEMTNNNVLTEMYSLEPLWKQLYDKKEKDVDSTDEAVKIGEMFRRFEQEFGRPLSPFEIERINHWIDEENHSIDLIYDALREAVLMSKLNFTYIDRILLEWKKKGIQSSVQAKQNSRNFHHNQRESVTTKQKTNRKALYYNWLDES